VRCFGRFYAGQSTWLCYQARLRKLFQLLPRSSGHEEGDGFYIVVIVRYATDKYFSGSLTI
jgi:hypothetical protein